MDVSDKTNAALHGATDAERDALKQALKTNLQRRRQLKDMSKPALIDYIMSLELSARRTQDALRSMQDRVRSAYEEV